MSGRPEPLEHGDLAHLPWGSIRWSVARQMRLAAEMTAQAGGDIGQYAAVLAGDNVPLTSDQVRGLVPPSKQPSPDLLAGHPLWVLEGDDTLRPPRRKRRARKAKA